MALSANPLVTSDAKSDLRDCASGVAPAPPATTPAKSSEFWNDFNATLDELFRVVQTSRERLSELTEEVAKRDTLIARLQAQNALLRARLGLAENAALENVVPYAPRIFAPASQELTNAPASPKTATDAPVGPGPARGIWQKLTTLEREI